MNVCKILGEIKNNAHHQIPLVDELNFIKKLNPNHEVVKTMYGQLGYDLFEGKSVSLLENPQQKPTKLNFFNAVIMSRIKPDKFKFEYNDGDPLWCVVLKYIANRNKGVGKEDLVKAFGQRGLQETETIKKFGFFG